MRIRVLKPQKCCRSKGAKEGHVGRRSIDDRVLNYAGILLLAALVVLSGTPASAYIIIYSGQNNTYTDLYIDDWVDNSGTVNTYGTTTVGYNGFKCFFGDCSNIDNHHGAVWNNYGAMYLQSNQSGYGYLNNDGTFRQRKRRLHVRQTFQHRRKLQ